MNQKKETAKERREQLIREMLATEFPEERRSKVLSLRVEESLFKALEDQAEEWNLNISEALRKLITFYFLPLALEQKWREVLAGAEIEKKSFLELIKLDLLEELYEDFKKGSLSMKYLINEFQYIKEVEDNKLELDKERLEELFMTKLELNEVAQ